MSEPPPPERSGWKARRHRRRDRQRAALQAEVATHDPSDVAHFEKTARRYFREAIRAKLREHMLAPWDDDGAHGLRVVIDLGMQELMCDAERRSLVTQLQLSYADPLRLAVDAVEKASVSDASSRSSRALERSHDGSFSSAWTSSQRHRALEKADDALGRFERSPATRLLFSSLSGVFEKVLANDKGSERWSVRRSARRFDEAVAELAGDGASAENTKESAFLRNSIVVLSPDADATFSLHEPLDARAIYVVGGLCDYRRVEGATLRRAAVATGDVVAKRLPIEDAFGTTASVNILTVNQTVEILSRVNRNGGDWRAALLETLPERKLREMRARSSFATSDEERRAETRETCI